MNINYPNGQHHSPNAPKPSLNNSIEFGKRGMSLEEELNSSNQYYLSRGLGVIHKKPTPIQIVKVEYPKRSAARITEAYFRQASTTDYNGVYKGHYLDFDAKETTNLTSFPLKNFHAHQITHMKQCIDAGGICFTIIKFVKLDRIFLLKAINLFDYWNNKDNGGRQSIPLSYFEEQGIEIKYKIAPLIPYLSAVDMIM